MSLMGLVVGWLVWSVWARSGGLKTDELLTRSLPVSYQAFMAEHGVFLDVEGILTTADSQSHCFQLDIQLDSFFSSVIPDCSVNSATDFCQLTLFEQEHVKRAAQKVRSSFRRSLKKEEPLVDIVSNVMDAMKDPTAAVSIANGQVSFYLY